MSRPLPARGVFRSGQAETGRVEAFSDGVMAVAITLLVLDIHVPHVAAGEHELWRALAELIPAIVAWVVSFAFILVFWVAHHNFFGQLARVDRGLLWLNGLFLLFIAISPLPTSLQSAYPLSTPATFAMSVTMFGAASSFALMRFYATAGTRLTQPHVPQSALRAAMLRGLVSPVLYATGMVMSFIVPWVGLAIQFLVPMIYFLPAPTDRYGVADDAEPG